MRNGPAPNPNSRPKRPIIRNAIAAAFGLPAILPDRKIGWMA